MWKEIVIDPVIGFTAEVPEPARRLPSDLISDLTNLVARVQLLLTN